jgi:hypothetical protein
MTDIVERARSYVADGPLELPPPGEGWKSDELMELKKSPALPANRKSGAKPQRSSQRCQQQFTRKTTTKQ